MKFLLVIARSQLLTNDNAHAQMSKPNLVNWQTSVLSTPTKIVGDKIQNILYFIILYITHTIAFNMWIELVDICLVFIRVPPGHVPVE
jgi:hypothetical protein